MDGIIARTTRENMGVCLKKTGFHSHNFLVPMANGFIFFISRTNYYYYYYSIVLHHVIRRLGQKETVDYNIES